MQIIYSIFFIHTITLFQSNFVLFSIYEVCIVKKAIDTFDSSLEMEKYLISRENCTWKIYFRHWLVGWLVKRKTEKNIIFLFFKTTTTTTTTITTTARFSKSETQNSIKRNELFYWFGFITTLLEVSLKIFLTKKKTFCELRSISPAFYEQLVREQIPKAQKIQSSCQSFLCCWDLQA